MRKAALWLLLIVLLMGLTGCSLPTRLSSPAALPDLRLLERPAYTEAPPAVQTETVQTALQLDLWLDATQAMGGINQNTNSMYPHHSHRYREGGFHYRSNSTVGLYENVLRCMLSAVEGSRVRLLRYGNERLTDEYLVAQGLVNANAEANVFSSVRRDMLTYAVDPMPTVFNIFSSEKMTDSFYTLGTTQMNRLGGIHSLLLENPAMATEMSDALDKQIRAISKDSSAMTALENDSDYALLYALDNLNTDRLSVITCDPASIRRLNMMDEAGDLHALVQEIMQEKQIFDKGLSVGVYAFTLDYMGQMSTFAAADLSEPLLWGRMDYNNYTGKTAGSMPMPRTLLTFVIGTPEHVESFTGALNAQLDASEVLKETRGQLSTQLTYTQNGQTVTQEPFTFAYEYLQLERAVVSPFTQYTDGVKVEAQQSAVTREGSLNTVVLAPVDNAQPDRTFTVSFPLTGVSDSMSLNAARLTDVRVEAQTSLLLSEVLNNSPDTVVPEGAQNITLRDKVYVFTTQEVQSPVVCTDVSSDGETLTVTLQAQGEKLQQGYYRLLLTADLPGESLQWQTPAWVNDLNANVTNEQIASWETFTKLLTRYERNRNYISKQYQSAWGPATNAVYYGQPVPDFPPVMRAPGLAELVRQLQSAAHPQTMPYIRFVFDVFVTNQP